MSPGIRTEPVGPVAPSRITKPRAAAVSIASNFCLIS